MIENKYVSFETAKLLKQKGFVNDFCFKYFEQLSPNNIPMLMECYKEIPTNANFYDWKYSAPTLQMALDWLNERKGLYPDIALEVYDDTIKYRVMGIYDKNEKKWKEDNSIYDSMAEAIDKTIRYCLDELVL